MKRFGLMASLFVALTTGSVAAESVCVDRFGNKVQVGNVERIAHREIKGVYYDRTCQSDGSFAFVQSNAKGALKYSQDWDSAGSCSWEAEKLEVHGAPVFHEANGAKYQVGCVPKPGAAGYNLFAVYAD